MDQAVISPAHDAKSSFAGVHAGRRFLFPSKKSQVERTNSRRSARRCSGVALGSAARMRSTVTLAVRRRCCAACCTLHAVEVGQLDEGPLLAGFIGIAPEDRGRTSPPSCRSRRGLHRAPRDRAARTRGVRARAAALACVVVVSTWFKPCRWRSASEARELPDLPHRRQFGEREELLAPICLGCPPGRWYLECCELSPPLRFVGFGRIRM